nr:DUF4132 domain-containing protein [uncultured Eisenbergiella sp.]
MEYSYQSRQKLMEAYREKWKKKLFLASGETKEAVEEIEKFGQYRQEFSPFLEKAEEKLREGTYLTLSDFMRKNYKKLTELYTGKEFAGDFYYIIDKLNQFPYSYSIYRRTVRTKSYFPSLEHVFRLLYAYKVLQFYECSLEDYLLDRLPEEKLDFKRNPAYGFTMQCLDDMIAARIDRGDETVKAAAENVLLSDNNTAVITVDWIRGIVKSSCASLHRLLSDFLLAARLQEGIRQAVCENADCGTIEAFRTIFAAVCDNNLIRFASVKRAVATWTGICDVENADRISEKMITLMEASLTDPEAARAYIASNDSIRIAVGLWTLAFYELQDAIGVMGEFLEHGTRNQILTMSYFNRTLEWDAFTGVTAKKAVMQFSSDPEMIAAFMPTYLSSAERYVSYALGGRQPGNGEERQYRPIPAGWLFDSRGEALAHYGVLKDIVESMKKKVLEFAPCVFPWYRVELTRGQLIKRMCVIAYSLGDSGLIEEAAAKVMEIDISGSYDSRAKWVELLLHSPENEHQKELLLSFLADKETMTRKTAFRLAEELELSDGDYRQIEAFLKYKKGDIRQNVLKLLEKQSDKGLEESVRRLLSSSSEEMREGGLTLVREARISGRPEAVQTSLAEEAGKLEGKSDKEQILLEEITGESASSRILETEGYGLYRKDVVPAVLEPAAGRENLQAFFRADVRKLEGIVRSLFAFLDENAGLEYKAANGYEMLLGNHLVMSSSDTSLPFADRYPFKELWVRFYEEHIGDPHLVKLLLLAWNNGTGSGVNVKNQEILLGYQKKLLGNIGEFRIPQKQGDRPGYGSSAYTVLTILNSMYEDMQWRPAALELAALLAEEIPAKDLWYKKEKDTRYYYVSDPGEFALTDIPAVNGLLRPLSGWRTEQEFKEGFSALYRLDQLFDYNAHNGSGNAYSYNRNSRTLLTIYEYVLAFRLDLIPADTVYRAAFETIGLRAGLEDLSRLVSEHLQPYERNRLSAYLSKEELAEEKVNPENPFVKQGRAFFFRITDTILDVEVKRGDLPTVFSASISSIKRIYGMDRMIEILKALGNDKLDRTAYYYWSGSRTGKKECLSYLLQICYPLEGEDAGKLKELLRGTKIKEQKLIETAMYAPQWLDIIEEYLGWPGLKSGCYYFMAHMNERFDDKKKAMIARYTPLTPEELNNGAFDVNWFEEAYSLLGEERFGRLYDAAKYISDGSKHARARKYADAALGRVTAQELEPAIREKRNKDLLMSYGLPPVQGKREMPRRYEFLQQFLKESRQFGAQRRASESLAVSVAMKNMATKAGYADVTRLTLAMETELVKEYRVFFEKKEEDGVFLCLYVDENGRPSIMAEKDGRPLKTVPARLKKNAYYLQLKEIHTKLKEQYARCVKMFEQAMEEREAYRYEELQALLCNPVIAPVVRSLVFIGDSPADPADCPVSGFIREDGMTGWEKERALLRGEDMLRVAHPFDLYELGCWEEYQKLLFAEGLRQPFKQVFRELYVKLPEELDRTHSLMFAGNQIQPAKTAACLKSRRWVADYEEGLQKIYYKENIIAHIYAQADWFSPSEVEAPALEWVEFTHRKTFEGIPIRDIPAVVYSEVMRDVDLAVSVAHAGGVDPETSHSTVEMRKAIVEYNLPLFGISNVTLEGSHALIKGSRAAYSIHLGSGVIHRKGGHQIQVLPVHSQSRGRLFLPFLDEDPKTAEIMSKIVLFAQDAKIKDPYILDQIQA